MKKVFLNISKYSQENACVGVSFLFFFQDYYVETPTQVFSCEYFEIFKNSFLYRTPLVADSENTARFKKPRTQTFFTSLPSKSDYALRTLTLFSKHCEVL